jgi:hypothetical protein
MESTLLNCVSFKHLDFDCALSLSISKKNIIKFKIMNCVQVILTIDTDNLPANFQEILENNFSLIPSKYISFIDKDDQLNFDVEMKKIQTEFKKIIKEEKQSQAELVKAFNDLGYEL